MTKPSRSMLSEKDASRVFLLLYGVMGFMTLSHEVAWTRQLIGMVGSALGAVSIMLAVFMGGMALGSFLGGRFARTASDPIRFLATACIMAGGTSLLSIPIDRVASIARVGQAFPALGMTGGVLVVLAAAIPVMSLPALFVGAAFPVLANLVAENKNLLGGLGKVLAAQTFGSIAGALSAGFWLLPAFGVDATFAIAGGVTVLAGALVSLVKADVTLTSRAVSEVPQSDHSAIENTAMWALALSGFATLMYEIAWSRELLLVFGSSVYATAVMLASVLLGLGLGQWWGSGRKAGVPSGLVLASRLMFGAAVTGLFSSVLTRGATILYTYAFTDLPAGLAVFAIVQVLLSGLVVFAPAFMIGAASPLMIRFAVGADGCWTSKSGTAYAVNTIGAVAGSLVAGFIILPMLSAKGVVAVAAVLQLSVALIFSRVARRYGAPAGSPAIAFAILISAVAAFTSVQAASPLLNMSLKRTEGASAKQLVQISTQSKPVYFRDTSVGRVAVYQLPDGRYVLRGSGMVEGGQGIVDAQTTELLVRLPASVEASGDDYLVVGLGTGSTTYTALQASGARSVDTIELNPAVIAASRYFVGDSLERDPRSHINITDARVDLATLQKKYNVIVSEPSYPLSPFSAQLFTSEFFDLERSRLKPDGISAQWLPVYLLDQPDIAMMVKTFASTFPNTYIWSTRSQDGQMIDLIMLGENGKKKLDPAAMEKHIRATGGEAFKYQFEFGPDDLKSVLDDATIPINTDDKPLLEYRTPLRQIRALWR